VTILSLFKVMSTKISLELEPVITKSPRWQTRKEIDSKTFGGLCEVQCTLEEIAHVLRVSEDTVERWCKRTYELGFADAYKKFSAIHIGPSSKPRLQAKLKASRFVSRLTAS